MSVSKAKQLSNKKHDSTHFKYQSVKLKIGEYEHFKKAVEVSGEKTNSFLRTAIMNRVGEYVPEALNSSSEPAVPTETAPEEENH